LDSTGSFLPHLMPTTAHPHFRPPSCTNRICGSMTFGCFHQDNHSCDFSRCRRQIGYAEFGWHCPHCDRDYCITCHPVPWEPVSSVYSDIPSTQNPGTQELLHNDSPPLPLADSLPHEESAPPAAPLVGIPPAPNPAQHSTTFNPHTHAQANTSLPPSVTPHSRVESEV
jgi:hypothetical protein